jgi:hypothetical protein
LRVVIAKPITKILCVSMGCGNLIFTNADLLFQSRLPSRFYRDRLSRLNTNQRFAPRNDVSVYCILIFLSDRF